MLSCFCKFGTIEFSPKLLSCHIQPDKILLQESSQREKLWHLVAFSNVLIIAICSSSNFCFPVGASPFSGWCSEQDLSDLPFYTQKFFSFLTLGFFEAGDKQLL